MTHIEDLTTIRRIHSVTDGRIVVEGLIDEYDYESGRNDRISCCACGAEFKPPFPLEFV